MIRKRERLRGRPIPYADRNGEKLLESDATLRRRFLVAAEPTTHDTGPNARSSRNGGLRAGGKNGSEEEPGPLVRSRDSARVDSRSHYGRVCSDFATVSSHIDEPVNRDSLDAAEVSEHRSEKFRERMEAVGRRIRFAREEAHLSLRDLAKRCDMDHGGLSRLERGENLEISAARLFGVCEALLLDFGEVWHGKKPRALPRTTVALPDVGTPQPPSATRRRSSRPPKKVP